MINFKIHGNKIFAVSSGLVSFDIQEVNETNIHIVGYSKAKSLLMVLYANGKMYIYQDVPELIWDKWKSLHGIVVAPLFGKFQAESIKGEFRFYQDEHEWIRVSDAQALLAQHDKLMYHHTTTVGLWATDRKDMVIDNENVLYQITA